ncbi:hypothetical protein [Roseospira goensis]|uniref:Uncharacterized protein n=1 Tax=Roseospira goensis TaxID=391922 RepID=A0A7W6WMC5_9PROT|nr:hypothetical protein [Roseospira goensis]MBB4287623.1 hypothetical protein [Roseospira goensis]
MTDSARFAGMADPERNPQFRRRWIEPGTDETAGPAPREACAPADDPLDHLGNLIATDFRAARAGGEP